MGHYTKLWSFILDSTIWREQDHTRIVWITMLAMADQGGYVAASIPGLADRARVAMPLCEQALAKLGAPDTYSRSKEHEGRRIKEVEGGWIIINYGKHREAAAEDVRRQQNRERQRAWRERLKKEREEQKERNENRNGVTRDERDNNAPSRQVAVGARVRASVGASPEKKNSAAEQRPPSGDHQVFIAFFKAEWEKRHHDSYAFNGGKDGTAVKAILTSCGSLEHAEELLLEFLNDEDQWIAGSGHTLCRFRSELNRYKSNGHKPKPQLSQSDRRRAEIEKALSEIPE